MDFDKINILGHSWGSFLAIFYGLTYPENLDKLILMAPQPMDYNSMVTFEKIFEERLHKLSTNSPPKQPPRLNTPEEIKKFYLKLSEAFCYDPKKAKLLTLIYDLTSDKTGRQVAQHLNQKLFSDHWDYMPLLKNLNAHTLIIHGAQDPIPLSSTEKIHLNLSKSRLLILDKCRHFPYIEQAEL